MFPLAKFFSLAAAALLFANSLDAQHSFPNANDTIWGNGIVQTIDEEQMQYVGHVKITFKAQDMQQVIPETEYEFTTSSSGSEQFNIPTYIDLNVGVENYSAFEQTRVFPTVGSEINASFSENSTGSLEIYSIDGQKVLQQDFNTDHLYKNLESLSSAVYIYTIKTSRGNLSGKFVKTNSPANGSSLFKSTTNIVPVNKSLQDEVATYWVIWEHEDFYTDSTLMDFSDGNNGFLNIYMLHLPTLPINQDISGIVMDGNNNKEPLEGVIVVVEHENTGNVYGTVTDDLGHFIINDLPVQIGSGPEQDYKISIGGIDGKYSFMNIAYQAPRCILDNWTATDTINANFNAILYNKIPESSSRHIKDQTSNGYLGDTMKVYYDGVSNSVINQFEEWFDDFEVDEPNSTKFVRSMAQLNNEGLTIEMGSPNTTNYETNYETPIGNLSPVLYATSTMGGSADVYYTFVHEVKRAIGMVGVAWPEAESVMEDYATHYTEEDKLIGEFESSYWREVYKNNSTYIDLNNLAEDIDSKIELLGW